jgi:hypothetical protein
MVGVVYFLCPVFSENITFKSGKTISGKITKKTNEFITVDISGVTVNYYLDEIDSINGVKITKAALGDDKSTSSQRGVSPKAGNGSWLNWYSGVKDYLDKFDAIGSKSRIIAQEQTAKLVKARDDLNMHKIILTESAQALSSLFNEFKALNPPPELKGFHQKLLESYKYVEMVNDAVIRNDKDSTASYKSALNTLTLEAFSELRDVYIKHGAPQRMIEPLDKIIARCLEFTNNENEKSQYIQE